MTETAERIAEQLGENGVGPREQIRRALEVAGPDVVQAALAEAQQIEASGGLMLKDSSRRRTPGGVFFYVLRQRVDREQWLRIQPEAPKSTTPPPPPPGPLAWDERADLVKEVLARPGSAGFARLTVIGRPQEVKPREGFVIISLEGGERLPPLPHGLPKVPALRTTYKVAIVDHQWRALASALNNPEDVLIAEGFAFLNAKTGSVIVLAQRAMTKFTQRREKALRRHTG